MRTIFVFLTSVLAVSLPLRADVTGSILGTVRDSSQAVVAGATVVATNAGTNLSKSTVTGQAGEFRLLALPAGTYRVVVTAQGFQQFVTTGVEVSVNDQLRIDPILQVGSIQQEVNVAATAIQVETENTQLGDVIENRKMLSLPLNGRSYVDLLGLQAGVAPATAGSIQQDRPVSGGLSAGNVSVNGQRETANAFLVNGGDVSEGRNMGAAVIPNLDSIAEFRLITNSFRRGVRKVQRQRHERHHQVGHQRLTRQLCSSFCATTSWTPAISLIPDQGELRRNQFGYAVGGPFLKEQTVLVHGLPGHAAGARAPAPAWCPVPTRQSAPACSTRPPSSTPTAIHKP